MRKTLLIIVIIAVLVVARMCLYAVDASEYVYVTVLGQHQATYDGGADGAGLHFGWPWPIQAAQRLDRRLQYLDLPTQEILTHDPDAKTVDKTLTIEAYACWRIADADGVDRFIKRLGTTDRVRLIVGGRINSQLGALLSQKKMDDLVSTEPGAAPGRTKVEDNLEQIKGQLLKEMKNAFAQEYGIELVDLRLRRLNHPVAVQPAIFDRIKSERNKKAAEYRSEGEREAKNIESTADAKVREILARASAEEVRLKGEADSEAARIRNEAHSQDPEFYAFLKKMEKLQSILGDNRTVLLLSTHRQIFDLLFQPPRPGGGPAMNGAPAGNGPSAPGQDGKDQKKEKQ